MKTKSRTLTCDLCPNRVFKNGTGLAAHKRFVHKSTKARPPEMRGLVGGGLLGGETGGGGSGLGFTRGYFQDVVESLQLKQQRIAKVIEELQQMEGR